MTSNVRHEIEVHERLVHGSAMEDRFKNETQPIPLAELVREIANRLHHSNTELRKLLESNVTQGLLNKPLSHPSQSLDLPTTRSAPSLQELDTNISTQQPQAVNQRKQTLPTLGTVPGNTPPSPMSLQTSHPSTQPTPLTLSAQRSTSPRTVAITSAAQAAHLQDLQHQLAVKTLAHDTLQKEYTTLLQRLERQRVKCATLERKFEVSDAEIISLSNEKERLEQVVEMLEKQREELAASRDDARKRSSEASAQYLRMIELAGKLHSGNTRVEGSGVSALEREALAKRVEELEAILDVKQKEATKESDDCELEADPQSPDSRMTLLETEVKKLKLRNSRLENGLIAAKQAAITLAAHGQNVGTVLGRALDEA
jgi:hypothetical protein